MDEPRTRLRRFPSEFVFARFSAPLCPAPARAGSRRLAYFEFPRVPRGRRGQTPTARPVPLGLQFRMAPFPWPVDPAAIALMLQAS